MEPDLYQQCSLATRTAMIFLGITIAVPLGGGAIPLWLAIQRKLWPQT
jgi:hypothetical protein